VAALCALVLPVAGARRARALDAGDVGHRHIPPDIGARRGAERIGLDLDDGGAIGVAYRAQRRLELVDRGGFADLGAETGRVGGEVDGQQSPSRRPVRGLRARYRVPNRREPSDSDRAPIEAKQWFWPRTRKRTSVWATVGLMWSSS
jgi:hypothetical protein